MSEAIDSKICELRLELNHQKEANTALGLELVQSEETFIKLQAEQQKQEATHQDLRVLKTGMLKQDNDTVNDTKFVEVEIELDRLKAMNKDDTNAQLEKQITFEKLLSQYEKAFTQKLNELETIASENDTTKRHLANLELAFSDVHQKYERAKQILEGFRTNEEMLQHSLVNSSDTVKKNEEKYESLKAHAKAQLERSNKELHGYRQKHQFEVTKMSTIIKRLEIKNASLVKALDQKSTECEELAALCNELTGRVD